MSQEMLHGWLRAIDEALVVSHVGCVELADDYETAKRKLNNLLCHSQSIGEYFAAQTVPNLACKSVQARLAAQWGYVKGDTRDELNPDAEDA